MTARDKSGSKNAIIGTGEHRYECFHDWGNAARRRSSGRRRTASASMTPGMVYIKHQGHGGKPHGHRSSSSTPRASSSARFGKEYYPGGHGIDMRKEGGEEFLYLCDVFHRQVVKTTLKGEEVWKLCYPTEAKKYQPRPPVQPDERRLRPRRRLLRRRRLRLELHPPVRQGRQVGAHLGRRRRPSPARCRRRTASGSTTAPAERPSLVVADRANARLQYFTLDGKHLGFVNDVLFPAHFDIRGEVLLVPDLHARVSLFDKDNKPIVHLGDDPAWRKKVLDGFKMRQTPEKWQPGKFIHPHDACFDQRRQHLRRRVGPDRPRLVVEEGLSSCQLSVVSCQLSATRSAGIAVPILFTNN